MKLYFKQRFFSWFDSYDIYDKEGNVVYTVKGQLSWGHCLHIHNANGEHIATIQEKIFRWLPTFEIYKYDSYVGHIKKKFQLIYNDFEIDYNGWTVEGDWLEWDYSILNKQGAKIATVEKQLFKLTDTYVIDVYDSADDLDALLVVLAIDAEKCSRK